MYSVYLAGPIAGLTYDGSEKWRTEFISQMPPEIVCYSPLRGQQVLRKEGVLSANSSVPDRHIMVQDHFDVSRCDMVVCNLLGAKTVSIGTVMECAWAYELRKPLLMIMEPTGNIHDHPMIREAISFRATDLISATNLTKKILMKGYRAT